MKLTIEQLKNYLETGLKVYIDQFGEGEEELIGIIGDEIQTNVDAAEINLVRPICYRLSDLDKLIPELGFVPLHEIKDYWRAREVDESSIDLDCNDLTIEVLLRGCDYTSERDDSKTWIYFSHVFHIYNLLFQWHFWPFGDEYFEQGLVIDKLKMTEK